MKKKLQPIYFKSPKLENEYILKVPLIIDYLFSTPSLIKNKLYKSLDNIIQNSKENYFRSIPIYKKTFREFIIVWIAINVTSN